ncbi:MAG: hypothetical protein LBV80_05635 [Deltaproteobacteria bacterium]|nr:hypothetical protein [Deltaproteobacteria bacterium]
MNKKTPLLVPIALLVLILFSGGCQSQRPIATPAVPAASTGPASSCVLRLGAQQLTLPGPSGFVLQNTGSPIRKAAAAWLTPPETIFAVYAKAGSSGSGKAASLQNNSLVIVSALPEFSGLSLSGAQFASMRNDLTLANNVWHDSAPADFARLSEDVYRDLAAFSYSLGVYQQSSHSISVARIVKNRAENGNLPVSGKGTRPDANGSALSHTAPYLQLSPGETIQNRSSDRELNAKAGRAFADGSFTLSIRNLLYARGKIFNIYYNVPLRQLNDIKPALEANSKYIKAVTRQGLGL